MRNEDLPLSWCSRFAAITYLQVTLDDEHEPWQELHYNKTIKDLSTGFQLRIEERFILGVDGVLPRMRLLEHLSHPIGETRNYVTRFWGDSIQPG